MKRVIIAALVLAFAARAQDAGAWWNALAADGAAGLPDVTDGLVAWWKLDGSYADEIGGHDLTGYGTSFTNGISGQALDFTRADSDYASASDTGFPTGAVPRSITFWASVGSYNTQVAMMYGAELTSQGLWISPANSDFGNAFSAGFWFHNADSGMVPDLATWTHFGFVFDSLTNVTFYKDGTPTLRVVSVPDTTLSGTLFLGRLGATGGYSFDGFLDDVRVYNRALSSNEVSTIYNRYK